VKVKAYNTLLDRGDVIEEGIDNLTIAGDDKEIVKEAESMVEENGARKGKQRDELELFNSEEDTNVVESDSDSSCGSCSCKSN